MMGVYGRDILFPGPPPGLIQKLGIVLWLHSDVGDEPEHVIVTILLNKNEMLKAETDLIHQPLLDEDKDATKKHLRMTIPMPPFVVEEEGAIEVLVDTGRENLRAGRLFIRFPVAAAPEAAGPEAEQ